MQYTVAKYAILRVKNGRMDMDTEKYQALLQAVEQGSITAAARDLGYSPSGLTRMLDSLERDLGFSLLFRTSQGVQLTREGNRLLPAIRELLYWSRQIREESAGILGLEQGELFVGSYYSIASCWLPEILRAFQQDYPGIRVHVQEAGNQTLLGRAQGTPAQLLSVQPPPRISRRLGPSVPGSAGGLGSGRPSPGKEKGPPAGGPGRPALYRTPAPAGNGYGSVLGQISYPSRLPIHHQQYVYLLDHGGGGTGNLHGQCLQQPSVERKGESAAFCH